MAVVIQLTSGHTWNELGDQLTPELLNKMLEDGSATITNLPIKIGDGGTGATTATAARDNIGFADKHIEGFTPSFSTASKILISGGSARNSTDTNNIISAGSVSADLTVSGANGLDTGVEAIDTWYAAFVIVDTTGANLPVGLFSTSATAPTLPSGYDIVRRIGWARNNAASDIRKFFTFGGDRRRRYVNDVVSSEIKALAGGVATSFTAVSLAAFMPPTSLEVEIRADFENAGGTDTDTAVFRPTGSAISEVNASASIGPGILLTNPMRHMIDLITDSSESIDYAVTAAADSLDLYVLGYTDEV